MSKEENELVFPSPLDSALNVAIIYPGSDKYDQLIPHFERAGHAFLMHDLNLMVVDGAAVEETWFSEDHLLVIQAHELGHFRAGHSKSQQTNHRDEKLEREADWVGYNLLRSKGLGSAADLHRDEYHARYGDFPEAHNELFSNLKKFIK
jgi:hypothetical protein